MTDITSILSPTTWVIVGAALLILEMLIPTFIVGSFGVSAFFAAGAAALGWSPAVQIILFGVLGLLLVLPARRYLLARGPKLADASEALIGTRGVCVVPVSSAAGGKVRVQGATWNATSAAEEIATDTAITVLAVDGIYLTVAAATTTNMTPTTTQKES